MLNKIMHLLFVVALTTPAAAQQLSQAALQGAWEGQHTWENYGGGQLDTVIEFLADGTYDDSSGKLMPPVYDDTQTWSYDPVTNRVGFRYLSSVYAGRWTYTNIWYEVVGYTGNELLLHWNFWDDPEPHPASGVISLQRAGGLAPVGDTPGRTVLRGNHPNPFNPATTVAFSLGADENVRLEIFDARGRKVTTLAEGFLAAGDHEYRWNATGFADGVYLCRLTTDTAVETLKMTLVK